MPTLAERQRRAAAVSHMILTVFAEVQREYRRKHIGGIIVELLVAMVIRVNDAAGKRPISVSAIAKKLGVPRETVRNATAALMRQPGGSIIKRVKRGYVGDLDYLAARLNAPYWLAIVKVIIETADQLRK